MFSSLFSASLKAGDLSYLKRFPRHFLKKDEVQAIDWSIDYWTKFGACPTPERVKEAGFGDYITKRLISSPLEDVVQMSIDSMREGYFFSAIREIETTIDRGETLTPGRIKELGEQLSASVDTSTVTISSFDRGLLYSSTVSAGLSFGFTALDRAVGQILPGEYAVLVARPGVGKSWLLCALASRWYSQGKKVLLISCEMPVPAVVARIDGIVGQFNPIVFRSSPSEEELQILKQRVMDAYEIIDTRGGKLFMPPHTRNTLADVEALIDSTKPDVVLLDGIYLLKYEGNQASQDWQRIKAISNRLKQMAIEYNTTIIGSSQLKRGNKDIPDLDEIAYSDSFGQDADLVLSLTKEKSHNLFLQILKDRNGAGLGSLEIRFDTTKMQFIEETWELITS